MATYIVASSRKAIRRLRNAAKACGGRFASRGLRAVFTGSERCVFLRAGLVPSVHSRDRIGTRDFAKAKQAWL